MEKLPGHQTSEVDPASIQTLVPSAEIDFNREVLSVAGDHIQIAVHGVAAWVAQKRMERAGKTMERMEHKDALYEDMANTAHVVRAEPAATASGEPAKPRTFVERYMDKRAETKSWKAALKKAQKDIEIQQFGGTGYTSTMGRKSKSADRKRRHQIEKSYRSGDLTAHERRTELDSIKATPTKVENRRAKQLRRQERRAHKSIDRTAEQPILSRWRSFRRDRAVTNIKRQHLRAEKYRALQEQTRQQIPEKQNRIKSSIKAAYREGITSDETEYGFIQRQVSHIARASGRRVGKAMGRPKTQRPSDMNQAEQSAQRHERPRLETKTVVGSDGVERIVPIRPSTQARQGNEAIGRTARIPALKRTHTKRGSKYQEQQALNRQGVV